MTHKEFMNEMPSYADMYKLLLELKNKLPGSRQHIAQNLMTVLEQSAKVITANYDEQDEAIEQLNQVLR